MAASGSASMESSSAGVATSVTAQCTAILRQCEELFSRWRRERDEAFNRNHIRMSQFATECYEHQSAANAAAETALNAAVSASSARYQSQTYANVSKDYAFCCEREANRSQRTAKTTRRQQVEIDRRLYYSAPAVPLGPPIPLKDRSRSPQRS